MGYAVLQNAIIEVTVRQSMNGQTILSVFHYKYTDPSGSTDGDAVLGQLLDVFNGAGGVVSKMSDAQVNSLSFFDVRAQFIYPLRYRPKIVAPFVTEGAQEQTGLPQNVAACLTKRGDAAGRHFHGTLHLAGIPVGQVTNGIIQAAELNIMTALGQEIARTYASGKFIPVLFNRAAPATSVLITDTTPENTVRVMRRRTVGVGI